MHINKSVRVFLLAMCFGAVSSANPIEVVLDTSMLAANPGDAPYLIQFTLTNGDLLSNSLPGGPFVNPSNIVTASGFSFGGGSALDPATDPDYLIDGGASGDVRSTVTLLANHADNYFSQTFIPGSELRFQLEFTTNTAVTQGVFDLFNFGILDGFFTELPTQGGQLHESFVEIDFLNDNPPVITFASDPTRATSNGNFLSIPAPTATPVPEPGTFWLLGAALLLAIPKKFRKSVSQAASKRLPLAVLVGALAFQGASSLSAQDQEEFQGEFRGRKVTYQIVDGYAIMGGDMVIGEAEVVELPDGRRTAVLKAYGSDIRSTPSKSKDPARVYSHTVEGSSHLWPKVNGVVTVPYKITKGAPNMTEAINQFNTLFAGKMQWVPRTRQRAYIDINLAGQSSNSCFASLGFTGRKGILQGVEGGCAVFAMLHEMGHVMGLNHEQSRADRDSYVNIDFDNIAAGSRSQYAQEVASNIDLGLYDYVSLMHYAGRGFTVNGNPEMESIPAGMPFGDPPTFSAGDRDALERLYFSAPTATTIDTNPTGLPIIVDGLTYTAPRTFNWALNSNHTIAVPAGPQQVGGTNYIFGRWNSDKANTGSTSQAITVAPGSGTFGSPANAPAITVYTANYIKLTPFTPSPILDNFFSSTQEAGSIATNPAPRTFPGVQGEFFLDRELVTLTATPAPGNSFHDFSGDNTFKQTFGPATNPLTLPSDVLAGNFFVQFSSQPEVLITTNALDNNASNIAVTYDGQNSKNLPAAWAEAYDSGWTPGSTHNVVAKAQVSPNNDEAIRYVFKGWSDGVTPAARTVTVPNSGRLTLGALYDEFFRITVNVNTACAGSVVTTPALPADHFVRLGNQLTFKAQPQPGWVFASWGGTESGSTNPLVKSASETVATANFNVIPEPLAITSITPSELPEGSPAQTITITGSGFTPGTFFFLGPQFLVSTYVNSNTLTVDVPASFFATPNDLETVVENDVGSCSNYVFGPALHVIP